MTVPASLFLDAPEVQDGSMQQLSSSIENWPEEIIQKLKEVVPEISSLSVMVDLKKRNDENGCAVGSVSVTSPAKKANIPVVIKDFMLSPMDVFFGDGKLMPLTPDYFKMVFSSEQVFDEVEEFPTYAGIGRFEEGGSLFNVVYPPGVGRYAYASAGYPIIEEIAGSINGASIKDKITEKVAARFKSKGHLDLIQKIAALTTVNAGEYRQGVENLIPRNIYALRMNGPGKYNLLSNSDKVFHPSTIELNKSNTETVLSKLSEKPQDCMHDVDRIGEKYLAIPKAKDGVFLTQDTSAKPVMADTFGGYVVKGKSGVRYHGMVIPKVIDFNQNMLDLKIFISEGMSSMQIDICGEPLKNDPFKFKGAVPKPGQTGTFVYLSEDAKGAIATVPVTVESIYRAAGDNYYNIKAVTLEGLTIRVKFRGDLINNTSPEYRLRKIVSECDCYKLPDSMLWIPMQGFEHITDSVESYLIKEASLNVPVTLIHNGGKHYAIKGVDKYASAMKCDKTNIMENDVKFLLLSLGAGAENTAQLLKTAQQKGKAQIFGLATPPLMSEKIAAKKPMAANLIKIANSLKSDMIKAASYMDNSQTVDAMLSLNFVTPDNISKFVAKIPQFKAAMSSLASCLLASRLGMREIPEGTVASALSRMVEVVKGLEALRAMQEV